MTVLTKGARHPVRLTLNGEAVEGFAEPRMLLTDFLRDEIGATGTHVGCEHGVCGACTVRINGKAVRGCLTFAVQADGKSIDTVEGIAAADGTFSAMQQAFHENFALQCGYCTPGFLMTLADYLERNPTPSEAEIRHALSGNLCRCTGYAEIVAAVMQVVAAGQDRPPKVAG